MTNVSGHQDPSRHPERPGAYAGLGTASVKRSMARVASSPARQLTRRQARSGRSAAGRLPLGQHGRETHTGMQELPDLVGRDLRLA